MFKTLKATQIHIKKIFNIKQIIMKTYIKVHHNAHCLNHYLMQMKVVNHVAV